MRRVSGHALIAVLEQPPWHTGLATAGHHAPRSDRVRYGDAIAALFQPRVAKCFFVETIAAVASVARLSAAPACLRLAYQQRRHTQQQKCCTNQFDHSQNLSVAAATLATRCFR